MSNRGQAVGIGDKTSAYIEVATGVPQGSLLGPLMYNLLTNDLPDSLNELNCPKHQPRYDD